MINSHLLNLSPRTVQLYRQAKPFPYGTYVNFINPYVLGIVADELKKYDNWSCDQTEYVADHQVNKFYTPHALNLDDIHTFRQKAPITNMVLEYMYSSEVLKFLQNLTGIEGLMGDPEYLGGGVHKINRGGKLDIHADFNIHFRSNLWRRINVLIYLNKEWQSEWGGELELWEKDLSRCSVRIFPEFNRAAIFNITDDAFHGHPEPLNTPEGVSRYSLALYYYTKDRPEHEKAPFHPVIWR